MKQPLVLLVLSSILLVTSGCSSILSKTTGSEPIGTNKSGRSFGQYIDDELIETYIKTNMLKADPAFGRSHVNVVSYNGIVLLVGEIQTEAFLARVPTNLDVWVVADLFSPPMRQSGPDVPRCEVDDVVCPQKHHDG